MKPRALTENEIKKLQKKFPKIKKRIPKKRLTKEEIQYRQAQRKAKRENVCIFLITIFFLGIAMTSIYILYLMWTYKW
nr:MAG TPA: CHD-like protein [Caudoviricetes sp.]